jgi:hypothetical protein
MSPWRNWLRKRLQPVMDAGSSPVGGSTLDKRHNMDFLATLQNNICEVTFVKANGDHRTMICTLIPDHLPEQDPQATTTPQPDDLVRVWDLEEGAWRAFKPSRLVDIKFSKE